MMNGDTIKKAAINKAKQVANAAANGNSGKKRRKGQDLKPIVTVEGQEVQETSAAAGATAASGKTADDTGSALSPITVPTSCPSSHFMLALLCCLS